MSTTDRVAVVVVHGIADQRPGQTVRESSAALCHGGDGPPPYVQGEIHEVLVPVEKRRTGRRLRRRPGRQTSPRARPESRTPLAISRVRPAAFMRPSSRWPPPRECKSRSSTSHRRRISASR